MNRPAIPAELRRAVEVEAGHRCAISTCRATSALEVHHITEWATVKEHAFDNLILLCANCHARITRGEIDRKAAMTYKANLSMVANRYSDLERRVLEEFIQDPSLEHLEIDVSHRLLLLYLVRDGLLTLTGAATGAWAISDGSGMPPLEDVDILSERPAFNGNAVWTLTEKGKDVVARLREARAIE